MIAAVVLEHVFERTPDGSVWTGSAFPYPFFRRYLQEFSGVRAVARVRETATPAANAQRADGESVSFAAIPYYHGLMGYLRRRQQVHRAAAEAVRREHALILRVTSPIAGTMASTIRAQRHPFGIEVVCDPWEVFSPSGVHHPLRPLIRRHLTHQLRSQCLTCCAGAYVTEHALQERYPVAAGVPTFAISDVDLPAEAFVQAPPPIVERPFTLVMVGSLAQLYKGPDVLVDAIALAIAQGIDVRAMVIGDGHYRSFIQERIHAHRLDGRVTLLGQVPAGPAVRERLDQADTFVMPSRTEGMPRALLEAMARGLPCLASRVGGIPEVLPAECLLPPGDTRALATAIIALARDPQRRQRLAHDNLERVRAFAEDALAIQRNAFLRCVRETTAAWQKAHGP